MCREPTLATVHRVHSALLARGWRLLEPAAEDLDDCGRPNHQRVVWSYPHSYGGAPYNEIQDVSPEPAACLFDLDSAGDISSLVLVNAGNHRGCPRHDQEIHHVDHYDTEQLGTVLNRLEAQAQHLAAHELIHCRFFGPCGRPEQTPDVECLENP